MQIQFFFAWFHLYSINWKQIKSNSFSTFISALIFILFFFKCQWTLTTYANQWTNYTNCHVYNVNIGYTQIHSISACVYSIKNQNTVDRSTLCNEWYDFFGWIFSSVIHTRGVLFVTKMKTPFFCTKKERAKTNARMR